MSGWENPAPTSPRVLAQSGILSGHTGDLLESILATIPVAGGLMGLNGAIQLHTLWEEIGAGATVTTLRVRIGAVGSGLGGAVIFSNVGNAVAGVAGSQVWTLLNQGAVASQIGATGTQTLVTVNANGGILATAFDTSQPFELNLTGQVGTAANTVRLRSLLALLFP